MTRLIHVLALARDLLASRSARVGEIGFSVGYESEAAFSRAFKKMIGVAPVMLTRSE